jgi:para-aminobenzoate synthetase/4-amino-4-deoxychorismate lyase
MARSAEYFGYPFDGDELRRRLRTLAGRMPREPRRVRVTLSPAGDLAVEHSSAPRWEEPVRLALARRHVGSADPFWYHKTVDRSRYEAHDAIECVHDQVLLVNERGELAETPIANLVVELDGALWTPHVDAGLLPGVLRAELLASGAIRERALSVADLERATAVWVINSLRGWGRAEMVATADWIGAGHAVPDGSSPVPA